jgi:hypothetical protein
LGKKRLNRRATTPPQNIITCIHCGKSGGCGNMRRYHNDNCKFHPNNLSNTLKEIETNALKRSIKLEKIQTHRKLLADREERRNISGRKKREGNPGEHPLIQCVFCRKIGGNNSIKKWHGKKCKLFTELISEPFFILTPPFSVDNVDQLAPAITIN